MTGEEAAKVLSLHLMQCGMLMPIEWVQKNGEGSQLHQAMRMALDALNEKDEAAENKPLTIEELREMHEQPVWCESMGCWGIVTVEEYGQWAGIPFLLGHQGCRFELNIESRGLVVYRMKPVEGGSENESAC